MNNPQPTKLYELHNELAEVLLRIVQGGVPATKDGEVILGPDGKPLMIPAPASYLNTARQFLKDNGIDEPLVPESPLGKLAKTLPVFDPEPLMIPDRDDV